MWIVLLTYVAHQATSRQPVIWFDTAPTFLFIIFSAQGQPVRGHTGEISAAEGQEEEW